MPPEMGWVLFLCSFFMFVILDKCWLWSYSYPLNLNHLTSTADTPLRSRAPNHPTGKHMKLLRFFRLPISNNFLMFLICFFICSTVDACLGRFDTPDPNKPELYNSVFIAKVESFKFVPSIFSHFDLTPPYEVVLSDPITLLYGEKPLSTVVRISAGCGIPIPQVGNVGVFFVSSEDPKEIEPLLYDDHDGYNLMSIVKQVENAVNALDDSISGHQ